MANKILYLPSEKQSRQRVQAVLNDDTITPKEKCLFLNDELGRVLFSVWISREWKDSISNQIETIMCENNLTIADFKVKE